MTTSHLVMSLLDRLSDLPRDGLEISELDHALQAATRAQRAGASADLVVAALCHDLGKVATEANHGPVSAEILRPYVGPEIAWVVSVHQDFVAAHRDVGRPAEARRAHRRHRAYRLAERFCEEWDVPSLEPGYASLQLRDFEPYVEEVFERRPRHGRPSALRRAADAAGGWARPLLGDSGRDRLDGIIDSSLDLARAAWRRGAR